MVTIITKLTGHEAASGCVPGGVRLTGVGAFDAAAVRPAPLAVREAVIERPGQAPAVAAAARKRAYAAKAAFASKGAAAANQTFGQQNTQLHSMWALRGLDPWSDPA